MKIILKLVFLSFLLQSFRCSEQDNAQVVEPLNQEYLNKKKQAITNYVNGFSCSELVGCGAIALGSKACGGPKEYLLYSNNVSITQLQQMVTEYNAIEATLNLQTGAVSDCMLETPPNSVSCVNGVCSKN